MKLNVVLHSKIKDPRATESNLLILSGMFSHVSDVLRHYIIYSLKSKVNVVIFILPSAV